MPNGYAESKRDEAQARRRQVHRYCKRPGTIEACQLFSDNMDDVAAWCEEELIGVSLAPLRLQIRTSDGETVVQMEEWLIRDENGKFHVHKNDAFEATYKRVE